MKAAIYELLVKRMKEYDLPSWPGEVPFDRVLVYSLPDEASASEKYLIDGKESAIIKTDEARTNQSLRSPRGIVVSAGLGAMDKLHCHGMKLGDIVWLAPHVPYRFQVGNNKDGKPIEFLFCYVGDICLGEDIGERIANGTITVERNENNEHVYVWKDEKKAKKSRTDPTQSPDSI